MFPRHSGKGNDRFKPLHGPSWRPRDANALPRQMGHRFSGGGGPPGPPHAAPLGPDPSHGNGWDPETVTIPAGEWRAEAATLGSLGTSRFGVEATLEAAFVDLSMMSAALYDKDGDPQPPPSRTTTKRARRTRPRRPGAPPSFPKHLLPRGRSRDSLHLGHNRLRLGRRAGHAGDSGIPDGIVGLPRVVVIAPGVVIMVALRSTTRMREAAMPRAPGPMQPLGGPPPP